MDRQKTFVAYIMKAIISVFNIWATIVTILLAVLTFSAIPSNRDVSLGWFIILILIFLFIFLLLLRISWLVYSDTSMKMPKVKHARQPHPNKGLLLLEPSGIFSHNNLVAIYYFENELEVSIGVGEVINIQENHLIQIRVQNTSDAHNELWTKIYNNDAAAISRLIVKPYLPREFMEFRNE